MGATIRALYVNPIIPNAQFVPLDSKNHLLLESESAWQRFLSEVKQFVQPQATSSASKVVHEVNRNPEFQPNLSQLKLTEALTEREQEILELIAQGLSNTQISEQLVLSPKMVKNHITHTFSKM